MIRRRLSTYIRSVVAGLRVFRASARIIRHLVFVSLVYMLVLLGVLGYQLLDHLLDIGTLAQA